MKPGSPVWVSAEVKDNNDCYTFTDRMMETVQMPLCCIRPSDPVAVMLPASKPGTLASMPIREKCNADLLAIHTLAFGLGNENGGRPEKIKRVYWGEDLVWQGNQISGLITFDLKELDSSLFLLQVVLAVLTMAYIPFTHMSHFFMKYFLYHDIRWEDKPNVNAPEIDDQIDEVLGYQPTWSAPHVAIPGKKTWADIALFNPAAEPEEEKKTE